MNMKLKQITLGALTSGFLLTAALSPVFAQDVTPSPSDVPAASTLPTPSLSPRPGKMIRQELKTSVQAMKGDIRADRAKIHGDRLTSHFAFYNLRLTNIDNRIQSLIETKRQAGKNIDAAQTQLNAAKATLVQAIVDGNQAVAMFNAIPVGTWSLQKPDVKAAIAQAQVARKAFALAHTQSQQAVKLLQNL